MVDVSRKMLVLMSLGVMLECSQVDQVVVVANRLLEAGATSGCGGDRVFGFGLWQAGVSFRDGRSETGGKEDISS